MLRWMASTLRYGTLMASLLSLGLSTTACSGDLARISVDARRTNNFSVKQGQRVAVMTFAGKAGPAVTDLLSMELMRKGIDVVDRDMLDRIVGEMRRAEDGSYAIDMSDQELIARIGRIVGADVIVFGQVDAVHPNVAPRIGQQDWGEESPKFAAASAVVSVRAYSATTGEVVWWATSEAAVSAPDGDYVRMMDYLRFSARNAAWALTDPTVKFDNRVFKGEPIPR